MNVVAWHVLLQMKPGVLGQWSTCKAKDIPPRLHLVPQTRETGWPWSGNLQKGHKSPLTEQWHDTLIGWEGSVAITKAIPLKWGFAICPAGTRQDSLEVWKGEDGELRGFKLYSNPRLNMRKHQQEAICLPHHICVFLEAKDNVLRTFLFCLLTKSLVLRGNGMKHLPWPAPGQSILYHIILFIPHYRPMREGREIIILLLQTKNLHLAKRILKSWPSSPSKCQN
jgi:hypothetical protein